MSLLSQYIQKTWVSAEYSSSGIDLNRKSDRGEGSEDFYKVLQGLIDGLEFESQSRLETKNKLKSQDKSEPQDKIGAERFLVDKEVKKSDPDREIHSAGSEKSKQKITRNGSSDNIEDHGFRHGVMINKRKGVNTGKPGDVLSNEIKKSKINLARGFSHIKISEKSTPEGSKLILREKIAFKKLLSMMRKTKMRKTKKLQFGKDGIYKNDGKKISSELKQAIKGRLIGRKGNLKEKSELKALKSSVRRYRITEARKIRGVRYSTSIKRRSETGHLSQEVIKTFLFEKSDDKVRASNDFTDLKDYLKDYTSKLKAPDLLRNAESVFSNTNFEKADEIFREIIQRFNFLVTRGGGEARIILKPDILGRLYMKISVNQHRVEAVFLVETEAVREMLLQRIALLEQGLAQQGFSLGSFNVEVGDENSWRNAEGQREAREAVEVSGFHSAGEPDIARAGVEGSIGSVRNAPWIATKIDIKV